MKMFKPALYACLALVLAVSFSCKKKEGGGVIAGKIAIDFAGTEGDSAGQSRAMKEMADILNRSGKFEAKVYAAGLWSNDTDDMVEQAKAGVPLVVPSDPGRLASQFNIADLNILMAPYVLTEYKALEKLPQTELYKAWQKQLEDNGIVLLADMFNGFRNFYTTQEIKTVADLKNIRIRGFGNKVGVTLANYLGFTQTSIPATDIYAAIQSKALDGCEIQASAADSYRLYEVTKYLALTRHYMLQSSFVCGKALLDKMPAAEKNLFLDTVYNISVKYSDIIASEEQSYIDRFKVKGGIVSQVNIAAFERAIAPLYTNNDLGLSAGLKDVLFYQLGL